jgi:hypothetical protein
MQVRYAVRSNDRMPYPPDAGRAVWFLGDIITLKLHCEHTGGAIALGVATVPPGGGPHPTSINLRTRRLTSSGASLYSRWASARCRRRPGPPCTRRKGFRTATPTWARRPCGCCSSSRRRGSSACSPRAAGPRHPASRHRPSAWRTSPQRSRRVPSTMLSRCPPPRRTTAASPSRSRAARRRSAVELP